MTEMTALESMDVAYCGGIDAGTDVNGNESHSTTNNKGFNVQSLACSTTHPTQFSSEYVSYDNSTDTNTTSWQVTTN